MTKIAANTIGLEASTGNYTLGTFVRKFGRNEDVDSAAVEDIWDGGGTYTFPSAAAATTIVSDSANDKTASTGALTVNVFGLDSNWLEVSETVTMNGTDAVTLSNEYLRVHRAYVVTVGSNETNVGNIQVKHGSTVLAQITAGNGQTLMAIYTMAIAKVGYVIGYYASVNKKTTGAADILLKTRANGEAWRIRKVIGAMTTGQSNVFHDFYFPIRLEPQTDIKISAGSSTNDLDVSAGFEILLNNA
jgi:hypothetical protein